MAESTRKRIVIVGGGLSAGATLIALLKQVAENPSLPEHLSVEILEAGTEFAAGPAWSPKSVGAHHLMNTYSESRVEGLDEETRRSLTAAETHLIKHGEMPRRVSQMESQRDYMETIDLLRTMGVEVTLTPQTTVSNIRQFSDDEFILDINRGGRDIEKEADFVILATGHWQGKSKTNTQIGVYDSPWPASNLEKIDSNQSIAVMGTNLSAIDAMITLAHKAGNFSKNEAGKTIFTPNANAEKFKLVAYSPSGMLPLPLGHDATLTLKTKLDLTPSIDTAAGFASLDDIYNISKARFIEECQDKYKGDPSFLAIRDILETSPKIEDAAQKFYDAYKAAGPEKWLRDSLEKAKESRKSKKALCSQDYLRAVDTEIEGYYNALSAEDQQRFMKHVRPIFTKIAYGVVQTNGEQMLALMEAGRLEVTALGAHSSLGTEGDKPGAEIRYTDSAGKAQHVHYNAVVKASSDDPHRLKDSSPLMRNLFKGRSPLVQEVLFRFKDTKIGAAEFAREQAEVPEELRRITKVTHEGRDNFYRSAGGIDASNGTLEVKKPRDRKNGNIKNLFIIGPLVKGHLPLLEGFGPINRQSKNIASTICKRALGQSEMHHSAIDDSIAVIPLGRTNLQALDALMNQLLGDKAGDPTLFDGLPADIIAELKKNFGPSGKDHPRQ